MESSLPHIPVCCRWPNPPCDFNPSKAWGCFFSSISVASALCHGQVFRVDSWARRLLWDSGHPDPGVFHLHIPNSMIYSQTGCLKPPFKLLFLGAELSVEIPLGMALWGKTSLRRFQVNWPLHPPKLRLCFTVNMYLCPVVSGVNSLPKWHPLPCCHRLLQLDSWPSGFSGLVLIWSTSHLQGHISIA